MPCALVKKATDLPDRNFTESFPDLCVKAVILLITMVPAVNQSTVKNLRMKTLHSSTLGPESFQWQTGSVCNTSTNFILTI